MGLKANWFVQYYLNTKYLTGYFFSYECNRHRIPALLQRAWCDCHSCVTQDSFGYFFRQSHKYSHEVPVPVQVRRRLSRQPRKWTTITKDVSVVCTCAIAKLQTWKYYCKFIFLSLLFFLKKMTFFMNLWLLQNFQTIAINIFYIKINCYQYYCAVKY